MKKQSVEIILVSLLIVVFAGLWINNLKKGAQENAATTIPAGVPAPTVVVSQKADIAAETMPAATIPQQSDSAAATETTVATEPVSENASPFKVSNEYITDAKDYYAKRREELKPRKPEASAEIAEPREIVLPTLALEGITKSAKGDYAIINGRIVEKGDTVEGAKITEIKTDAVVVTYEGKTFTVNFAAASQREKKAKDIEGGRSEMAPPKF